MYQVTVFPLALDFLYTSYVWTGLSDLDAEGRIELSVSSIPRFDLQEVNGGYVNPKNACIFYMEATNTESGERRRVFIDLMDNFGISSESGIRGSDVYFKRSYRESFVRSNQRFQGLTDRVLPFGLFFPVASPYQRHETKRLLLAEVASKSLIKSPRASLRRLRRHRDGVKERRAADAKVSSWSSNGKAQFEGSPTTPDKAQVVFLTRAFDPQKRWRGGASSFEEVQALNEQRAAIMRAMRRNFGTRFIGGFMDNAWAREHYPDCIAQVSTDRSDYLKLMGESRAAISTTGLADSIPAKIAEYLAGSRCVITERLRYELPFDIEHGKHAMIFDEVDECVSHADKLLSDDAFAAEMRANAHELYHREVEPANAMMNRLDAAFAMPGASAPRAPGRAARRA